MIMNVEDYIVSVMRYHLRLLPQWRVSFQHRFLEFRNFSLPFAEVIL